MDWRKYCKPENWHEDANLLPVMDSAALAGLAEDIAAHGVQQPIVLFQGKVLDGRNRLRACAAKEVSLTAKHFIQFHRNGSSPREFVLTQNLHRRHLTIDQRAALAAELVPMFREEAKKRVGGRPKKSEKPSAKMHGVSGKSSELAARFVGGVSVRYVEQVLSLEAKKAGTLAKIKCGKLAIREAKKEVDQVFQPRPLSEQFGVPPFTVLDARQGDWLNRKRFWHAQGVSGGHNEQLNGSQPKTDTESFSASSVFDPVLAECVYRWFAPKGGRVLDPFAGEPTKGIVAAKTGLDYIGIDLRDEQVEENRKRAKKLGVSATWWCGDSAKLTTLVPSKERFDLIFTSPPYYDLEIYSKSKKDGSAFETYDRFLAWYQDIFRQAVARLKPNRFLVVKVGDVRDEKGFYRNFVGDNISCFLQLGLRYYNEAILVTPFGTAPIRVRQQFPNYRKMVKTHQNLLCFFKGDDPTLIPKEIGVLLGNEYDSSEQTGTTLVSAPVPAGRKQPRVTGETVRVKISAKSARLLFEGCSPDYIRTTCHGHCCEAKDSPTGTGTMIPVSALEQPRIEALGARIVNGLIQPRPGEKQCPFKTSEGMCDLHTKGEKPFGCIASPFMLNSNDTLIIRNRYKLMNCRRKDGRTPAYKVFRASLDQFFGKKEAQRICKHLDNDGGDIEAQMLATSYEMHKGTEKRLIR
jgi:DNA modification methylase